MTPLNMWPFMVYPVNTKPPDAACTILGGCLHIKLSVLLSCKWVSSSEQKGVRTYEREWWRQVLESRNREVSLQGYISAKALSSGSPSTPKDKNGNPLWVWLTRSVLLRLGCTSKLLRSLFNCKLQFSGLGAQAFSISIQLPGDTAVPWKSTWESVQEVRCLTTFWRAQFPLTSVSQPISWVSDYLTIDLLHSVFWAIYTHWLIDIFWGRITGRLIKFFLVACLFLFNLTSKVLF